MPFQPSPSNLFRETTRLRLREFNESDVEPYFQLESIPEVVRYQDFGPRTMDESRDIVRRSIASRTEMPRTIIELAIEERVQGNFMGRVGASLDHANHKATLWFSLTPSSQGRGYANEAVRALILILRQAFRVQTCEIECDPRNHGTRKLAERLRFAKVKEEENVYESKGEWVGSVVYKKDVRSVEDEDFS